MKQWYKIRAWYFEKRFLNAFWKWHALGCKDGRDKIIVRYWSIRWEKFKKLAHIEIAKKKKKKAS